jgi:hypothetical protein
MPSGSGGLESKDWELFWWNWPRPGSRRESGLSLSFGAFGGLGGLWRGLVFGVVCFASRLVGIQSRLIQCHPT